MSLKVASVNVNGIRAAVKQRNERNPGMLSWLQDADVDVVCMQEVRATEEQATKALEPALEDGWHLIVAPAAAKGRAGVGILSRAEPEDVTTGYGDPEFADSGRFIEAVYPGAKKGEKVRIASLYLPSGSTGTPKQDEKERFMATFWPFLEGRAKDSAAGKSPEMLVCGDWNIAHQEADLKNHKNNHKTSGFLPEEREWLTGVLGEGTGWVDVVRSRRPDEVGPYSWWSQRGKAFDNNAGWRIDYHMATAGLASRAVADRVDAAKAYDERWSDHAPVVVDYK